MAFENLYETDFYAWTMKQAEFLRHGRLTEVDLENVAEEIESMGKSQKREFLSRLSVLLMHLLKWQYQKGKRSNSWKSTIIGQRRELMFLLSDNPSLKSEVSSVIEKAYSRAVLDMTKETGISKKKLQHTCPYTFEQVMDDDFWPEFFQGLDQS